jgi:hypothetical protein
MLFVENEHLLCVVTIVEHYVSWYILSNTIIDYRSSWNLEYDMTKMIQE